jgi:hypothetical protein
MARQLFCGAVVETAQPRATELGTNQAKQATCGCNGCRQMVVVVVVVVAQSAAFSGLAYCDTL